jgi:hypothetical protein
MSASVCNHSSQLPSNEEWLLFHCWSGSHLESSSTPPFVIRDLLSLRLGYTALACLFGFGGSWFGGNGKFTRSGQTGSSPPLRL